MSIEQRHRMTKNSGRTLYMTLKSFGLVFNKHHEDINDVNSDIPNILDQTI